MQQIFAFSYDSCCFFVNNLIISFLKLTFFIACYQKDSQNFFMQSLPLYTSCLFSILINKDLVDIEKPDWICLLTFVVDDFSGLFLHSSIFFAIHSRSAHRPWHDAQVVARTRAIRAERIWNCGAPFFVRLVNTFGARVHHGKTCTSKDFIKKIVHHIVHLEQTLSIHPTHQTIGF